MNPKILVVDDDDGIRDMLEALLQEDGWRVNVARNGREALDVLSHEPGWVVLLDINMPVMTGADVLHQLQEHPEWRDNNRVIVMSAGKHLRIREDATDSNVVYALLPKPFNLERLLEMVAGAAEC